MMDQTAGVPRTARSERAGWIRVGLLVVVAAFTLGVAPWLGGRASAAPGSLRTESYAPLNRERAKRAVQRQGAAVKSQVKISNFKFGPRTLTVKVGTKVTWINKDAIGHSVNFSSG